MSKEMNLGEMLYFAQRKHIFTKPSKDYEGCHFPYDRSCVVIGNFAMQTHSHDTGNSTSVYIIGGEKPYKILSGTYWKRGGYDHNPFHHEHGAWDDAFNSAIKQLREAINKSIEIERQEIEAYNAKKEAEKLAEKQRIESLFA